MDESEENMSTEDINNIDSPMSVKIKPKKRSLVERELETNMTARVTSPVTGEGSSTSRYGRARRLKTAPESEMDKVIRPLKIDVSKHPQAYKMHASNSPISKESPKRTISVGSCIEDQIENIYTENMSLSRFGSEEKIKSESPTKKFSKIYIQKDLIQKPDTDTVVLIKNMFSPNKSSSHLNNILERSSEKYSLNGHGKKFKGFPDNSSVVKTLDFDSKKKKPISPIKQNKKEVKEKVISPLAQSKKDTQEKLVSPLTQSKKDIQEKLASPLKQNKKEVKEKLVSPLAQTNKNVKEKLVSPLKQNKKEVKEKVISPLTQTKKDIQEKLVSPLAQTNKDVKEKLVSPLKQNKKEVKEKLVSPLAQTNKNVKEKLVSPLKQNKKEVKEKVISPLTQTKKDIQEKLVSPLAQTNKDVKEKLVSPLKQNKKEVKEKVISPLTQTKKDIQEKLVSPLAQTNKDVKEKLVSPLKQNKKEVKEKVVSPLTQSKKDIQEKLVSPLTQSKKNIQEKLVSPLKQNKKEVKEIVVSPLTQSKKDIQEKLVSPIAQQIKKEVKESKVSKNELFKLEAACEYQVGDLAWARVGTYPFWPCIITREPFSDMFVKKKLFGRVERSVIHVTFFGDNGRRGWIVDNMLRKYHGRAEFEACRGKFTPESKKKDPRFYAAHFVSEKKLALWNVSVEEAETLMKEPKRFRVDALYDMLEKARAAKTTPCKRDTGGKITRTDSDVSLSESLYDTLFSEDDGKSDDNRSKRARNKTLDVSEVVTACLDNMAARSGIIQIQRQSHMDRWLQKAKSKTPEKIQPLLHVKVEREKRKDKVRKKKEGKKLQKMRKNESLGSDTNLLPYQNEHDYSSVNYENHDINDSLNKNTDSASGLDSTLDTSTTVSDIGVTVKIENISSSMEDCSQDDIITTIVNDDIVVTESENISKDYDNKYKNETSCKDLRNNKVENNNEHMDTNKKDQNKIVEIKEEFPLKSSNVTNTIEPRRSKRKRRTFEGLNNSITGNKAKEPKLDYKSPDTSMDTTTLNDTPKSNKIQETISKAVKVSGNVASESNESCVTNLEKKIFQNSEVDTTKLLSLNISSKPEDNLESIISGTMLIDNNEPTITNLEKKGVQDNIIEHNTAEHILCNSEPSPAINIEPVTTENTAVGSNVPNVSNIEEETSQNSIDESTKLMKFNCEYTPVVDIEPLNSINMKEETSVSIANCKKETSQNRKYESIESIPLNSKSTPMVVNEPLHTENKVKEIITPTDKILEKETSKDADLELTELTLFYRNSMPVVVIEPLGTENTAKEMSTPTVRIIEKETSKNADLEPTEFTLFNSKSKPVVVIEQLDTENTVTENTTTVTNLEKEISKYAELESTEVTLFNSKSKPVLVIETHDIENTITKNTSTVPNLEKETSKNAKLESTELTLFNSKSKPVVVIEPLDTENTVTEITPTVTNVEKETSKYTKLESTELSLLNSKCKPVVVIEPLNYETTATESCTTIVSYLGKETSPDSKYEPIELISFHKSSKPVVVIEPLDMHGLETQFIIKGSKRLVLNNKNHFKDKKETPRLSSDIVQNDACNILKDDNNMTEASSTGVHMDISIQLTEIEPKEAQEVYHEIKESLTDSESMEVDDSASGLVEQKQANSINIAPHNKVTECQLHIVNQPKANEEPTQPLVERIDEILDKNINPKVVIGEETYIFDRTLSQDYDEIDGERYDEYSHLPPVIIDEEAEIAVEYHNNLSNHTITSLQDSCKDNDKTSNFKSTETISSAGEPVTVEGDSRLQRDCLFFNKESVQNDFLTVSLEDNKVPAVAGDVSSTVNEENNSNQVSQDNNDKCIFLDQSLKTADVQSAENIEKKRKSPRLSLNRTRNRTLKLNKVDNRIQTSKIDIENINTHSEKPALESLSINCTDNEMLFKNAGQLQKRQDSEKSKNDPEFVKYTEIRQDALLDEQPDLTQDEVVTYLYQNWLYEEGQKSNTTKIDDNEQSNLGKGFQKQPKKTRKKVKVQKPAELKNVDIRVMVQKGNAKYIPDESERQKKFLTNHFEHKTPCEAFNKNSMSQLNKDLHTVTCNNNENTELDIASCREKVSINFKNRGMSTRRSRRSKDKQDSMKTMHELKEKTEEKYVLDTALINTKDTEESTTRPSRSSKEKHTNQTVNTDKGKCDMEISQTSSNESEMLTESIGLSKEKQNIKNAMNEPEFIKYFEMHQDALLDDQPNLSQDEIVTYLYQNWLYEEGNKSEMKTLADDQQYNLVKCQETASLENCSRKATTDTEKHGKESIHSKSSKTSITEYSGIPGRAEEQPSGFTCMVPTIQKIIQSCVLNMAQLNDSEMSVTNRSRQIDENKNSNHTISTDHEKCVKDTTFINSKDRETAVTKNTERAKEKQDAKKAMSEPEFISYLGIHQDALLDDQPDLTQDEIVTYLYQNWLYEEGNKSEMKKIDDDEQSNLVEGFNQVSAPPPKKIKESKIEKAQEFKNLDIREMFHQDDSKPLSFNIPEEEKASIARIINGTLVSEDTQINKQNYTVNLTPDSTEKVNYQPVNNSDDIIVTVQETKKDSPTNKTVSSKKPENLRETEDLQKHIRQQESEKSAQPVANMEDFKRSDDIEDMELGADELVAKENDEGSGESTHLKIINGFIEFEENSSKAKTNEIDPETVSIKSNDSDVSTTRKGRKEKDVKKSMDDPEFLKYLDAQQDALVDEQPDLTQEEIVAYLYQTWFYEESTKSDVKKSDETEQSIIVRGLDQELMPQPKKIMKKPKVEKGSIEKVKITDIKAIKAEKPNKVLKNADLRDIIQKPKRKATQSKPYYNEEFSDLEEEDLETFKIFDRDEENVDGEVIDEVELYFEQLTKPKPNVFKGYVRERVCEICYRASNLVKCKSCHGTYHVECVKNEAEITEVAGPTRGRKKKRGRKPKGYDPLMETSSQSDERSQDANNSEEINISIEDEAESHIVVDEANFETLCENKMKELNTDNQEEYASDQEINWEVEPGHCEIVDLKHKEKPIDYSDYKCNKCLKYETPICSVCKSNKSPKALTELRQKCQVAHCHRYYHLECLDHWPQTQFNSWEPSKTNKKQIEYIETLTCPRHVCHTCVSDDPRGCKTRFCGDKLARCVKCPATYHTYTKCLPAGTQILTGSQIICPRHYEHRPGKVPCHVNTGWCFICALGGTLICCEYCPTSFHAECLNIKPPEGSYMCEDCETGRLPLYGEMVWVKLGHYRWWPGIVLHPTEIPDNILALRHSQGEFVVRFFGQYDHYWVNRGRVFPFQEGDSGRISSQRSKIDAAFTTAMEHVQRACEILKKMEPNEEEDLDIASSLLPPHYVKLKVNKPAGNVVRRDVDANSLTQCDCDPNQPDPCGPYSHCLNRMLLTECGPLCRAGERCNNRAFERRLYPRLQAYRTPHRGWGLRTLEDIKQGQFVIEYVGELIDMEEFRRRMCRKHEIRDENFYFLTLDKERMIDAGPKGNLARFMNHCCEPNCETQKWTVLGDVRVGLFALYDIPANSEVTFNYNLECAGIEKKRCLCGAKRCSGYIGAKPKQLQEDKTNKSKHPAKRTYKKRKPVEEPVAKPKPPKIKIKPIKPRELTEIEKDVLIIKNATNGMSSDSEGSRLSVEDKNPKALKRKRVSFSTDELAGKKAKLAESEDA